MRNEFDDELNRGNRRKERQSSYKRPEPAAGRDNRQGSGRVNRTPIRENTTRRTGTSANSQSSAQKPVGENRQGMNRPAQTGARKPASSGKGQGTSRQQVTNHTRDQVVIGDGRTRQQQRRPEAYRQARAARASRSSAQAKKKKKVARFIIMGIAEVIVLALIFSYAYFARMVASMDPGDFKEKDFKNENLSLEQKEHMTGYRTIAIFGVDSRDGDVDQGNADVIILCNINRGTGEIKMVSVFRDTYLNTAGKNTYNKINSAYTNGGAGAALAAINKNLDLDIREYITFNWKSVADGINMLGGIENVEITKPEFRYINGFITETQKKTGIPTRQFKSAGIHDMDGVQAVAYARLRKMDTDFQRTKRQRLVIQKAFQKAKKADLGLLNRILMMEVKQVGTNLSKKDFSELLLEFNKYKIGDTTGFPLTKDDVMIGKKDCVIPKTLESNVSELHKFLFDKDDYEPTEMVKKISSKIVTDVRLNKKKNAEKQNSKKTTNSDKKNETKKARETTVEDDDLKETDESKNNKEETVFGETKPEETKKGSITPGETDVTETDGTTKEDDTGWTSPGETKSNKTSPGDFDPGPTEPAADTNGPGISETTKAIETETTSAGPGKTQKTPDSAPSSTSTTPTTTAGADNEVPVVSSPPGE
jgi:LCP family protein required for cell wall assembly